MTDEQADHRHAGVVERCNGCTATSLHWHRDGVSYHLIRYPEEPPMRHTDQETTLAADEHHLGALYGIGHPGPAAGCPYCTDTLTQAGHITLVDAYLAGLAARDAEHAAEVEALRGALEIAPEVLRLAEMSDQVGGWEKRAEVAEATVARVQKYLAAMGDPADPKHLHPQAAGVLLGVQAALDNDPALRAALDGERG